MNGEVKFLRKFKKKKNLRGGGVRSGVGVREVGVAKLWGRWVMWGMGDVNQE